MDMEFRSLRAANRGLYLGTALLVLGACAYTWWRGTAELWQLWAAGLASLATLLWGGYYAGLRYQVDSLGVSRHTFFTRRRILWAELTSADIEERDNQGLALCRIHLNSASTHLTLASDVLALDEVQELAAEMREKGLLPPLPSEEE